MLPRNPEAGETPAPASELEQRVVEISARIMWRAFPYFAWRYGERGRAFGRSDAGFLVTLLSLDEPMAKAQVNWLAGVLAPRGMPSLLLETQLESLGRTLRRLQGTGGDRLLALAAGLRGRRTMAISESTIATCEALSFAAASGIRRRRGIGRLIAAAVADRSTGLGEFDDALVRWLATADPQDSAWLDGCRAAHAHAAQSVLPQGGGPG